MLKIYEEKDYEDKNETMQFETFEKIVNRHASTLVIVCMNKMYELLIKQCETVQNDLH
jgi:hypothetical protein